LPRRVSQTTLERWARDVAVVRNRSGEEAAINLFLAMRAEAAPCTMSLDGAWADSRHAVVKATRERQRELDKTVPDGYDKPVYGVYVGKFQGRTAWTMLGHVCPSEPAPSE
jgi:hypothetical protein